eukprot:TRINITY_DN2800_c0_g1_i4.p1 TRINITY_DN2800_c0_g1~~TRINITY_DN2800_c0_g1_i4.p1  ORF type:complete len:754 (+),score=99.11 TRINITY_DN2800_c0_g1_i4:1371-3632(+)
MKTKRDAYDDICVVGHRKGTDEASLRKWLSRKCFVVLDNAVSIEVVKYVLNLVSGCQLLVTSNYRNVVSSVPHIVHLTDTDAAMDMFVSHFFWSLQAQSDPLAFTDEALVQTYARELVSRCHGHALTVAVCARTIAEHVATFGRVNPSQSFQDAVAQLVAALTRDITSFNQITTTISEYQSNGGQGIPALQAIIYSIETCPVKEHVDWLKRLSVLSYGNIKFDVADVAQLQSQSEEVTRMTVQSMTTGLVSIATDGTVIIHELVMLALRAYRRNYKDLYMHLFKRWGVSLNDNVLSSLSLRGYCYIIYWILQDPVALELAYGARLPEGRIRWRQTELSLVDAAVRLSSHESLLFLLKSNCRGVVPVADIVQGDRVLLEQVLEVAHPADLQWDWAIISLHLFTEMCLDTMSRIAVLTRKLGRDMSGDLQPEYMVVWTPEQFFAVRDWGLLPQVVHSMIRCASPMLEDALKHLSQKGIDLNTLRGSDDDGLLHAAVRFEQVDATVRLIDHGCSVVLQNAHGQIPAMVACDRSALFSFCVNLDVFRRLLASRDALLTRDKFGCSVLQYAARKFVPLLRCVLDAITVENLDCTQIGPDQFGRDAMFDAVGCSAEAVELLRACGLDMQRKDQWGCTAELFSFASMVGIPTYDGVEGFRDTALNNPLHYCIAPSVTQVSRSNLAYQRLRVFASHFSPQIVERLLDTVNGEGIKPLDLLPSQLAEELCATYNLDLPPDDRVVAAIEWLFAADDMQFTRPQ